VTSEEPMVDNWPHPLALSIAAGRVAAELRYQCLIRTGPVGVCPIQLSMIRTTHPWTQPRNALKPSNVFPVTDVVIARGSVNPG